MRTTLVSTQELASQPQWRVFDCRYDLFKPDLGEEQYRQAHIPDAVFVHLDRDLSAPKTGKNGRHPLPERSAFAEWAGAQGLEPSSQVVCYDAGTGAMAARLWWMLRWIGHEAVALLDGGFAKWNAEGRPVDSKVPSFAPRAYPLDLRPRVEALDVAAVQKIGERMMLVDARAAERFRGEVEPFNAVAGHIPGARNRFNGDNLSPQGTFKNLEQLRSEFSAILGGRSPSEVVHYCGSGVSACHNLLAMEIAGLPGGRLYAGSWSEWIADPTRPVETSAAKPLGR